MEENLKLNYGEAFSSLFQEGWFIKSLGSWIWLLLPVLLAILAGILFFAGSQTYNIAFYVLGGIFVLVTIVFGVLSALVFFGYYVLYAHDRAYDKNAKYRNWTKDTIKQAFIAGAKNFVFGAVQIPFRWIASIPLSILFVIIALPFFIALGDSADPLVSVLNMIQGVLSPIIYIFCFGILFTKIGANFIKDLDAGAIFQWGEALSRAKEVKGALMVPLIPYLYSTVLGILFVIFIIIAVVMMYSMYLVPGFILFILSGIFAISVFVSSVSLECNLLGQYTYNVIEKHKIKNN